MDAKSSLLEKKLTEVDKGMRMFYKDTSPVAAKGWCARTEVWSHTNRERWRQDDVWAKPCSISA